MPKDSEEPLSIPSKNRQDLWNFRCVNKRIKQSIWNKIRYSCGIFGVVKWSKICYTILMIGRLSTYTHNVIGWFSLGLGILSLGIIAYAFTGYDQTNVQGRLLTPQQKGVIPWVTIRETQIMSGATIPSDVNVIIKIPEDIERITRKTLFGHKGDTVRYWGYCFPEDYNRTSALRRSGFPGTLFLSEAEREAKRVERRAQARENFSFSDDLEEDYLNDSLDSRGLIRHQQEIFKGGMACYLMTSEPLPIGTDLDEDGVNLALEKEWNIDPLNPDSDGDGVLDGLEVFGLLTRPDKRDSDGDGIIDGIEDANRDGIIDQAETNPTVWDTDRDGLCDGLCKVNKGREIRGEDKNLNGVLDDGETDPRVEDTDGDSILDEQEYFNCLLAGGSDC